MMQRSFEVIGGPEPARAPGFTPITSSMDVPRPDVARKKRKRRFMIIGASALGLILISVVIARLKPAAMSVDRASVWIDTVKRGPMLRQVRGLGTFVPEDIRWIAASKEGRVEQIVVRPGAHVQPDTVILELSSPELEQAARDAESQVKGAEAELTTLRATLQRELLNVGWSLPELRRAWPYLRANRLAAASTRWLVSFILPQFSNPIPAHIRRTTDF